MIIKIVVGMTALLMLVSMLPRKEQPVQVAHVTTQYDRDRAFCNQWQDFCRKQGFVTPEMMGSLR
jgi:hypothetical protein